MSDTKNQSDRTLLSPHGDERMLLELAAKAAGYIVKDAGWTDEFLCRMVDFYSDEGEQCHQRWNPLTDDGDALRLVVKLNLVVDIYNSCVCYHSDDLEIEEHYPQGAIHDMYAATRRAIVRAAAQVALVSKEIGKKL